MTVEHSQEGFIMEECELIAALLRCCDYHPELRHRAKARIARLYLSLVEWAKDHEILLEEVSR